MKRTNSKKQRGSALLLTLGILSMALVMGMCFAFTARTSLQVAQVNADQTKARLIAESGLQRIMASLNMYFVNPAYVPYMSYVQYQPAPGENQNRIFRYMMSIYQTGGDNEAILRDHLQQSVSALPCLNQLNSTPPNSSNNYGFQPIVDNNNKLIGRVGYIIIDDTDKLDVNQMMPRRHDSGSFNSPFLKNLSNIMYSEDAVPYWQSDGTKIRDGIYSLDPGVDYPYNLTNETTVYIDSSSSTPTTIRLGRSLKEIWFWPYRNYYYLNRLVYSNSYFVPFASYRQMYSVNDLDHLNYTFFSGNDIEAYWDGTQECQRFDLTGYEWSTTFGESGWEQVTVATLTGATKTPFYSDYPNKTINPTSLSGIPYVNGLDNKEQIAANMIDFCDSNCYATYSSTKEDLLDVTEDTHITYFGNDYAPHINEFGLSFKVSRTDPDPDNENKRTFKLFVKPSFELLNIYPKRGLAATPAGKAKIVITGTLTKIVGSDSAPVAWPGGEEDKWVIDTDYAECNGVGFLQPNISEFDFSEFTAGKDESVTYTINITRINMVTYDSDDTTIDKTKIYDFAYWQPASAQVLSIPLNISAADSTAYTTGFSIQVSDPRINHRGTNWAYSSTTNATEATATDLSCFTAGAKNSNCTPPADGDKEDDTLFDFTQDSQEDDSHTFSTAFIPNRPFKSIWELGCIHTGDAFKTLDLLNANKDIVDNVKVGPMKIRMDTYNINAANKKCAAELFKNIDITRGYWVDSGTDASGKGPYTDEASTISSESSIPDTFELLPASSANRSSAAEKFKNLVSATAQNKRQQEALFGRTVGLLSTRICRYTILVTAEALRQFDISDTQWDAINSTINNAITDPNDYYSNAKCQSLGKQRILAHVVHDTWRNTFEIVQMEYLDQED